MIWHGAQPISFGLETVVMLIIICIFEMDKSVVNVATNSLFVDNYTLIVLDIFISIGILLDRLSNK
jgi:hypothetical protein